MKKTVLYILLSFLLSSGFSQAKQSLIDSLKHELAVARQDTSRVLLMNELSSQYSYVMVDSALYYGQEALALARKINYARGEANALDDLGWSLRITGNVAKALELYFKSIKIADKNNLIAQKASALLIIGQIYWEEFNDNAKALNFTFRAKALFDSIHNREFSTICEGNIGAMYRDSKRLDSAEYFLHQSYRHVNEFNVVSYRPNIHGGLGAFYHVKGETGKAINYSRKAIELAHSTENYPTSARLNIQLAQIYKEQNQIDSAIFFAAQSLSDAQKGNIYRRIIIAGNLLAELYEGRDSELILRYTKIASAAKDSLYNRNQMFALNSVMDFDEKERLYEIDAVTTAYQNKVKLYFLLAGLGVILLIAFILYRNNKKQKIVNKKLQRQKEEIQNTLSLLKSAQSQLIQSEKMASLGELTAGIAHEIQNPLNFVNNFSEVNKELVDELQQELKAGKIDDAIAISNDIRDNEEKINHHGKRADAIVKGMLQHSQSSSGVKEPTDINKLADEYLRLAYHGLRAKDKSFNAVLKTDYDETIGDINIIPQDIGKVILNLITNAFYAADEKKKSGIEGYEPTVSVSTKKRNEKSDSCRIEISVKDNGNGMPQKVLDKIFQPFFTTKPTGQGTGLGLSLSYDIVKAHGGGIKVESKEGEGSEFIVRIPA